MQELQLQPIIHSISTYQRLWKKHVKHMDPYKKMENSYRKMKKYPEERHTQTHGNLFNIF